MAKEDKLKALDAALGQIEKQFGKGSVMKLGDSGMLHGVFREMERKHYPDEMVEAIKDTLDCNPVFHGNVVSVNQMIGIMMGSIAVFGIIYYFVTLLPDGEGGR